MFSVCKVVLSFLQLDSFCPVTVGPKHLLWFTEVVLNGFKLHIACPAEARALHRELCH